MGAHPSPDGDQTERNRQTILHAMSGVSEARWCASWMGRLDRTLWLEGGVWETLGREYGWPLGYQGEDGWVSWDEAGRVYARTPHLSSGDAL